jgi:hypothetical protein
MRVTNKLGQQLFCHDTANYRQLFWLDAHDDLVARLQLCGAYDMCWNAERPIFADMKFGDLCILGAVHNVHLVGQQILPPLQQLGGVGLIVGNFCAGVERTELCASLHAVRDGNLMLHQDLPVFCRRLHDRQADLQRRETPTAAVQHWFAVHQRVVELVEFRGVGASSLRE